MKKIVAFIVFVSVLLSFSAVALAANESEWTRAGGILKMRAGGR